MGNSNFQKIAKIPRLSKTLDFCIFLYLREKIFQIAWDQTSKMGIAMASNEKATYVVAQYYTRKIFLTRKNNIKI